MPAPQQLPQYEATSAQMRGGSCRAVIKSVDEGSPAWEAGLEPGMVLTHVEGVPLRDIIEWRWWADGFEVEVTLDTGEVAYLERELGQEWGLEFDDVLFDGILTCRNACSFCFLTMLPEHMRGTLYVRDDDYRLSFLQGNFVTLTNLTDSDVERIIEYDLQPLHVSLHAVSPEARRELIGANAPRGMEALERILDAGLCVHTQLVVCPGVNDGEELERTFEWVEAHPGVLSCGIVPLGYTKFQSHFSSSFSDDPEAAARVVEQVEAYQRRSRENGGATRYHIGDEFYLDAGLEFPPASVYDGYPQFHDGIGMMRSFIDDWEESTAQIARLAESLAGKPPVTVVVGTAFARVLGRLVADSPLAAHVELLPVENAFFGGNVDVTCLLVGEDIARALKRADPRGPVIVSKQTLNADGVFLDDMTVERLEQLSGCSIELCTYSVNELLAAVG